MSIEKQKLVFTENMIGEFRQKLISIFGGTEENYPLMEYKGLSRTSKAIYLCENHPDAKWNGKVFEITTNDNRALIYFNINICDIFSDFPKDSFNNDDLSFNIYLPIKDLSIDSIIKHFVNIIVNIAENKKEIIEDWKRGAYDYSDEESEIMLYDYDNDAPDLEKAIEDYKIFSQAIEFFKSKGVMI
jgi:hypothetical protein